MAFKIPPSAALTVSYTVTGTATAGSDYTSLGTSISFAAGSSTATLTVTPLQDTLVEADETVILTLASGTDYTLGTPSSATVTLTSDDSNTYTVTASANPMAGGTVSCSPSTVPHGGSSQCMATIANAELLTYPLQPSEFEL